MSLEYEGRAVIDHINTRKEGPDDAKELAVDVKLTIDCDPIVLAYFDSTLNHFLFDGEKLRMPNLGPLSWRGEMQHMDVTLAGVRKLNLPLKKFSIEAYVRASGDPMVKITLSYSFRAEGNEVAILAEYLMDDVKVKIEPQPALPLGDAPVHDAVRDVLESGGGVEVTLASGAKGTVTMVNEKKPRKGGKK